MIVEELIKVLQTLPKDYEVVYETVDSHCREYIEYFACVEEACVDDKEKFIILKEQKF